MFFQSRLTIEIFNKGDPMKKHKGSNSTKISIILIIGIVVTLTACERVKQEIGMPPSVH